MTYLRFAPWVPSAFYGDDLYNLLATRPEGDFVHSWEQALVGVFYEKYRPVFVTIWFALTRISHEDLRAFLIFNGLVHTLNATIFYFLALALSRNNRMTSIALTLVFASSRFALYQVTQGTGPVESVALTFFLLMLLAISQALQQPERGRWQWLALECADSRPAHPRTLSCGIPLAGDRTLRPCSEAAWPASGGIHSSTIESTDSCRQFPCQNLPAR